MPTEYTISNLRKDSAYYLRVVGYDKAGNTAILEKYFSVGKAEIPEVIKSEYKEMVNGLVITGIKEKDRQTFKETLQQGRILLPENIQIFQVNSENAKQEKMIDKIIKQ